MIILTTAFLKMPRTPPNSYALFLSVLYFEAACHFAYGVGDEAREKRRLYEAKGGNISATHFLMHLKRGRILQPIELGVNELTSLE